MQNITETEGGKVEKMTVKDLRESMANWSILTQVNISPWNANMQSESGTYDDLSDAVKNAEIEIFYLGDFDKDHDLISIDIEVI